MDLHGQIMNLNCVPENMDAEPNQRLAYKVGHRDARHAAAELALKADAVIEAARSVLEWRVDTPTRGDLRDNGSSRDALRTLADAVKALETHNGALRGAEPASSAERPLEGTVMRKEEGC